MPGEAHDTWDSRNADGVGRAAATTTPFPVSPACSLGRQTLLLGIYFNKSASRCG